MNNLKRVMKKIIDNSDDEILMKLIEKVIDYRFAIIVTDLGYVDFRAIQAALDKEAKAHLVELERSKVNVVIPMDVVNFKEKLKTLGAI